MQLDRFDRRLLELVQADARQSHARLGERIGLSASSVRRRLDRLRAEGVILRDVSIVDPGRLGITVIVSIRMAHENHHSYDTFKKRMLADARVQQCYTVSGEVDFVVVAMFPDLPSYEAWIGERILADADIQRSDTNIVYSTVKQETAVPVEWQGK
jgi:DNA-binding Lrp family transcriptional regulator